MHVWPHAGVESDNPTSKHKKGAPRFSFIMRALLLLLLLAAPLSGCAAPEEAPPDALLVRVFVDDVDRDGHDEAVVRLAAWTHPSTVAPFTGVVEVTLTTLDRATIPRYHHAVVATPDFHTGAELPYFEVRLPAEHLRAHERVQVTAAATLVEGTRLEGGYETLA